MVTSQGYVVTYVFIFWPLKTIGSYVQVSSPEGHIYVSSEIHFSLPSHPVNIPSTVIRQYRWLIVIPVSIVPHTTAHYILHSFGKRLKALLIATEFGQKLAASSAWYDYTY